MIRVARIIHINDHVGCMCHDPISAGGSVDV